MILGTLFLTAMIANVIKIQEYKTLHTVLAEFGPQNILISLLSLF